MTVPYLQAQTGLRKSSVEQEQRDSLFQTADTITTTTQHATPSSSANNNNDSPDLRPSQSIRTPSQQRQQGPTKLVKPQLHQSPSFAAGKRSVMDTITPPRSDVSSNSPRQRYSDEANGPVKGMRKKTGFSTFVNNLVGSPRRPQISAPENPVHVTHVGYNGDTGEFTVSAPSTISLIHALKLVSGSSKGMAESADCGRYLRTRAEEQPQGYCRCRGVLQRKQRAGTGRRDMAQVRECPPVTGCRTRELSVWLSRRLCIGSNEPRVQWYHESATESSLSQEWRR